MLDLLPCYKANLIFMFTFMFIIDFFFFKQEQDLPTFLHKEHILAPTKFFSKSQQYQFRKLHTSDQGHLNEKAKITFLFHP